jgi:hypothetical protein
MSVKAPLNAAPGVKFETVASNIGDMAVIAPPRVAHLSQLQLGSRRILEGSDVVVDGKRYGTSQRFWSSLCARFGISPNIFNLFDHKEVFDRISAKRGGLVASGGDGVRVLTEIKGGDARFLGLTGPNKPYVDYHGLMNILGEYDAIEAEYSDGEVTSKHRLANAGDLEIAGEKYEPRFCLKTPIDGYGNPSIYLELMRLVCSNGATVLSSAFRTEIPLGKDNKGDVSDALVRMIQTYSNDEGFAAVAERINRAAKSWASVREARSLYQVLNRACPFAASALNPEAKVPDSKEARSRNMGIHAKFGGIVGDLVKIYGLTQVEGLSDRKASTLPVQTTVNDMINFATEVATHEIKDPKARTDLQMWVGSMLCREFDLEGSQEQCKEFKDFFIARTGQVIMKEKSKLKTKDVLVGDGRSLPGPLQQN